jgi:hypothetical protein
MEFQIVKALRALRDAIMHPERSCLDEHLRVVSLFAVAVLLLTMMNTIAAIIVQQYPEISQQMDMLRPSAPHDERVDVPAREFTGQLGGALMVSMGTMLAHAALLFVLARFMLNLPATFSQSLMAVASTAGIGALGTIVLTTSQVASGTIQVGPHLGWVVSPSSSPFLFAWLQRVNVFTAWEHVAAAIGLVALYQHHRTYGLVVGFTTWIVTMVVFAGFSVLARVLAGAQ